MTDLVPIRRALISLSDKGGLDALAAGLRRHGVEIVSTGGTAAKLREHGGDVRDVSEVTGFPEMMDGRVKTLHPKVHGGLLGVRDNPEHAAAMAEHEIAPIDLVVVNLYPFLNTVTSGADRDTIIENIDIGGPSMVRSAAKNHAHVAIVTDPADYQALLEEMDAGPSPQARCKGIRAHRGI
jgi:phosphoribosylaminoimidazolecarboxamide formyltransferase/IMP cyclohydrolase